MSDLETNTDVLIFLNKVLPEEEHLITCVNKIHSEKTEGHFFRYRLEITCREILDESSYFKIYYLIQKFFNFLGLKFESIQIEIIYQ